MKPAKKNTSKPIKNAAPAKEKSDSKPSEVIVLSRSVFTNGQYCAAIRVERTAA